MNNNEINPYLKKQLERLGEIPDRDLRRSHTGREMFLAEAKKVQALQTQQSRAAQKRRNTIHRKSLVYRLAGIFAVLLIALTSLGGTVYAAQASQPDDFLYSVKILTEDIQIRLESDPEDQLDLHVAFANRRLQEIQVQIDAGEEVSDKALALLEKHTQKMLEQAAKLDDKGINNALRQIEENLQKQNQMMAEMGKEHPQGGAPGLMKAQEKIRERLELVENGIKEPKEFKEKMKKEKSDPPGQEKDNGNSNKPETPPGQEDKDGNGNGKGKNESE